MQSAFRNNLYFASSRALIKALEWVGDPFLFLQLGGVKRLM